MKSEQNVCDIRGGHRRNKVWTTANSIIRKLVRKGKSVTKTLVGYELYANATAMIVRTNYLHFDFDFAFFLQ